MWHVRSRSGVPTVRTAIHLLLVTYVRSRSVHDYDGRRCLRASRCARAS